MLHVLKEELFITPYLNITLVSDSKYTLIYIFSTWTRVEIVNSHIKVEGLPGPMSVGMDPTTQTKSLSIHDNNLQSYPCLGVSR